MHSPTDADLELAREYSKLRKETETPKPVGGVVFVTTGSKRTAIDLPEGVYKAAVMNCKRRDGYLHVTLAVSEKAETTNTEGK